MKGTLEKTAVKMAAGSVRTYFDELKRYAKPFKEPATEAVARRARIAKSPKALTLISEGYPVAFADRIARMEEDG